MTEAQIRKIIKDELAVHLQIISSGEAGTNTTTTEDIASLFPGMPTLTARPIMHPFGFISRAVKGLISVTAQQGNHPGNKMTLGHRDKYAPSVDVGESAIYSSSGYIVKCAGGKIQVGKNGTFQTVVCGENLAACLTAIISAIVAHTHPYIDTGAIPPLSETQPPTNAADFTSAQSSFIDNNNILAQDGGGF